MKVYSIIAGFLVFFATNAFGQLVFDTVNSRTIGPGTQYMHIVETTKPYSIDVMVVDLSNEYVAIESVKANDKMNGLEKTTSMAQRKSEQGHQVIGAINGDFFYGTGVPINVQITNGEFVRNPAGFSAMGFTYDKIPVIGRPQFTGKLICNQTEREVNKVNSTRSANSLMFYNHIYGSSTNSNEYGTELSVTPITDWKVNDTTWFVAGEFEERVGDMAIPDGGGVLSAHGTAETFILNNISPGDTIALILGLTNSPENITQMVGGYPQIIKGGQNYVDKGFNEEGGPSHTYERHPRTAIGINSDSTKLFLITVDGRQTISMGMTLPELADFMILLGVEDAVNLDGGGSTTMVANHEIVNSPSDYSGERNVANAWLVVSEAPEGSLNQIKIQPGYLNIRFGSTLQLKVNGYDEFDNLLSLNAQDIQWEITGDIGTIDENGLFKANGSVSSGYIKVNYNNFSDSAAISVVTNEHVELTPSQITTDSILPINFKVNAIKLNGEHFEPLPEVITWSVENSSIGEVSQEGVFYGKTNGTTTVSAKIGNAVATAEVTVQIIEGTRLIDNMETPGSWTVTTSFLDSVNLSLAGNLGTEGEGCMEIFYEFTYNGRSPSLTMYKNFSIPGIPDSIWVDAKFDGKQQRISYRLSIESTNNVNTYSDFVDQRRFLPVGNELKTRDPQEYPYEMQYMKIEFWKDESWQEGEVYSGKIYLDNLRTSYPGHEPIITNFAEDNKLVGNALTIFPNPVNEVIHLNYFETKANQVISAYIYDIHGRRVSVLFESTPSVQGDNRFETNVSAMAQGVYFVKFVSGDRYLVKKMVLN